MVKRLLVLDGGGVKGVITLKFLSLLEEKYQINVSKYFDYFAGTSTGGLIAALMAFKGLSAKEILEEVYTLPTIRKIMSQDYYDWALSRFQMRSKYSDVEKMAFITKYLEGNTDVRMSDVERPLLLVGFKPSQKVPIFFRNYFHSPDYLLSQACNATSAAPTYFPLAKVTLPKEKICPHKPDEGDSCQKETSTSNDLVKVPVNSRTVETPLLPPTASPFGAIDSLHASWQYSLSFDNEKRDLARGVDSQTDGEKVVVTPIPETVNVEPHSDAHPKPEAEINRPVKASDPSSSSSSDAVDPKKEEEKKPDDFFWVIDGGIFANNPSDLAYIDAKNLFKGEKLQLLSVGTGISKSKFHQVTNPALGGWDWMVDDSIIDLLLDSNQVASHIKTKHMSRNNQDDYLRVNEYLRTASNELDNTTDENYRKLLEEGELWWRLYGENKFFKDWDQ